MGVGPRRCPLRHPLDVPEASTWNVGPAASFFHVTKRGPRKKPPGGERGGGRGAQRRAATNGWDPSFGERGLVIGRRTSRGI